VLSAGAHLATSSDAPANEQVAEDLAVGDAVFTFADDGGDGVASANGVGVLAGAAPNLCWPMDFIASWQHAMPASVNSRPTCGRTPSATPCFSEARRAG
jgi:hypothetical protein